MNKNKKERFKQLALKHLHEENNPCAVTDFKKLMKSMKRLKRNPGGFSHKQRIMQAHYITFYLVKKYKLDEMEDFGV